MPRSALQPGRPGTLARRDFLQVTTGAVAAATALPPALGGHAGTIRVGLIGCGGRGTGAAVQAALADPDVRIVALGDAFSDQLVAAAGILERDVGRRFDCPDGRMFSGPDAHRRVLEAGVDAVVVAAPPHLRPLHVEEAVAAGCHVYCETPAATDVAGTLRVGAALERARAAGRSVASGLHARRDASLVAAIDRLRTGALGAPRRVEVQAVLDGPWRLPVQPQWTAAEARLRNWITDDALSGGAFVERHVHALDRALWALGDREPVAAEPLRGSRSAACAVRYRFTDGVEIVAVQAVAGRGGTSRETVVGSGGSCELRLSGDGRRYQATMDRFLAGIRSGRAMDDTALLVRGTLAAIMGRLVSASGRPLAWEALVAQATPPLQVPKSAGA